MPLVGGESIIMNISCGCEMTGPNMWILLDPIGSRDNAMNVAQQIIWIETFGFLKAILGVSENVVYP